MPSRIGALAGRYILTRLLGEDAAISTFEGLDQAQDRPVLIELLPRVLATDPLRQEQLQRLAGRLAALEHPNLLSIVTVGLEEGVPYLIAEGVAATPLAEKMGQALDVERVADIISQVGQALIYAGQHGLFHGNLSPQKVLLDADDRVRLTDVGLESVLETPWEKGQEALSAYLAPERVRGWLPDAHSDVYALAVMLFEMLTGLRPDGPAAQALPWLREIAPDLAPQLEPILRRALHPDPQERYANVEEFMADLQPILAPYLRPGEAPAPTAPAPPPTLVSPQAPTPQPAPPPTLLTPALEDIPPIPMPEPPPMPAFDWPSFSQTLVVVPMPEPPPMPKVTAAGIEWPAVQPIDVLPAGQKELPEPPPLPPPAAPQQQRVPPPARVPARPRPRVQQPTVQPARLAQPARPPVQAVPRPAAGPRLLASRSTRQALIFLTVLALLVVLCCCWFIVAADFGNTLSTPTSHHPLADGAVRLVCLCPEKGHLHGGFVLWG